MREIDALEKALAGTALQEQLRQNMGVYELSSKNGNDSIPRVIIKNEVHYGPASTEENSHNYLEESFGLR